MIWLELGSDADPATTQPDRTGHFAVPEGHADDELSLYARSNAAPERVLRSERRWKRSELAGATVVFREGDPCDLRVECSDESGAPMRATVRVERLFGATESVTLRTADTDEFGVLQTREVGAGRYRVSALSSPSLAGRLTGVTQTVALDPASRAVVRLRLPTSASLQVTVVDAESRPVSRALVGLRSLQDGTWTTTSEGGLTDANGLRTFPKLRAGSYAVHCSGRELEPIFSSLDLGRGESRALELRMAAGGARVDVQIVSNSGEPLRKFRYAYLVVRDRDPRRLAAFWTADVDDAGILHASGLPLGEYELHLALADEKFAVRFGLHQDRLDLGKVALPSDRGTGRLNLRNSIPNARLLTMYRQPTWPDGVWRVIGFTRSGEASLSDLSPGRYEFALSYASDAVPQGFDLGWRAELTLKEGDAPPEVFVVPAERGRGK